jgi:succinate dehydrogenase/fumarate reductase flavoprotein subunit
MPGRWDADLVVLGFGAAGAAAALHAAELGASVIILEKQSREGHAPSARMSGGHVMGVSDATAAGRYLDLCAGGMVGADVSQRWAERAQTLVGWLDSHNTDLVLKPAYGAEHPRLEGSESIDVYVQGRTREGLGYDPQAQGLTSRHAAGFVKWGHDQRTGKEFFDAIAAAVFRSPRIDVSWEATACRLIRDDGGVVIGAATADGARAYGRHGVVLATGGYEFDAAMKLNYLKASPIYFYGSPANTGDGIRMAQAVGADLWHMNQMTGRAVAHFDLEDGGEMNFPIIMHPGGYVFLDRSGRRFVDETLHGRHDFYYRLLEFDPILGVHPRIPCYWIFDAKRMRTPLVNVALGASSVGMYEWSPDNSREIESGWIAVAETIEELAERIGVDSDAAAQSVREYNSHHESGRDPFGRAADSIMPLVEPPFGCVLLYPGGANTSGGPRRNARAEIVDPYGAPIPGLYGAGELGQAIGLLYPAGGCNLSEAMCFGQIAVEAALNARG